MSEENKTILLNQLRIMSAMQRLEYFVYQESIEKDLSEGIKDTQKILLEELYSDISTNEKADIYKQALIDIREYCNNPFNWKYTDHYLEKEDILQMIDKVLGGSDER